MPSSCGPSVPEPSNRWGDALPNRSARDAVLGWLLREHVREDGQKAVVSGVATHAYHLARDDGKDAAKDAADAARVEVHRLLNDGAASDETRPS